MGVNRLCRLKDFRACHSFVKDVTPDWYAETTQNGHDPSTHGGIVGGELLECILFGPGLRLSNRDTFIEIGSSTGLITNAVSVFFGVMDCRGIERDENRHQKAVMATTNINGFFNPSMFRLGDMTDPEKMREILQCERARIWFSNYGWSMQGTIENGFVENIEKYCKVGARIATFSQLRFRTNRWAKREDIFRVDNGDLSWTNNIRTIKVYFYELIVS